MPFAQITDRPELLVLCALFASVVHSILARTSLLSSCTAIVRAATVGAACAWAACVLLGAPLDRWTWLFATCLALSAWPPVDAWLYAARPCRPAIHLSSSGAVLGAWLGAVVVPLDWGFAWQVWPRPSFAGLSVGWVAGLLIGLLRELLVPVPRQR